MTRYHLVNPPVKVKVLKEIQKETAEHPSLPKSSIRQIVQDHFRRPMSDKQKFKITSYSDATRALQAERRANRKRLIEAQKYDRALARMRHESSISREYELSRSRRGKARVVSKRFGGEVRKFTKAKAVHGLRRAIDGKRYKSLVSFYKRVTA